MITPKDSNDLRMLRELRAAPGLETLRRFLIWLSATGTSFPAFAPGTKGYYVVNRVLNLIDQDPS